MIPPNLHWAFENGHRVFTPAGKGRAFRYRLANLVLPSGRLAIGYPGEMVNQPNAIQPQVSPGSYPVFISVIRNKNISGVFAFLTVHFTSAKPSSWEAVGEFFTDLGDGCIFDASVTELLRRKRETMPREEWGQLKQLALQGGDGNLLLEASSGANAIVFRTCDWSYKCFLGRDERGEVSSFVVDGRVDLPGESRFTRFLKSFLYKQ